MTDVLADIQARTFERATSATVSSYPPESQLGPEQLTSYLDRRSYAVVGSTRVDGRPHAALSLYLRRATTFWLPTVAGAIRSRNLRTQPWLTLVVTEGNRAEHIAVIVEGTAEVVPPERVPADVRAAVTGGWASRWNPARRKTGTVVRRRSREAMSTLPEPPRPGR